MLLFCLMPQLLRITFMYVDYKQHLYDSQELLNALSMQDFPFETNIIAALCLVFHYSYLDHFTNQENLCVCFSLTLQFVLPFY
jgi:hypothetical protein